MTRELGAPIYDPIFRQLDERIRPIVSVYGVPRMTDNVAKLFTDTERAEAIRAALRPHLEAAAAILDQAKRDGLIVGFNISPDSFGRTRLQSIDVSKPL